jgi:hypothetical protein
MRVLLQSSESALSFTNWSSSTIQAFTMSGRSTRSIIAS